MGKPCMSLYFEGILVKNFTILWLLVQEESWGGKGRKTDEGNHSVIAMQYLNAV